MKRNSFFFSFTVRRIYGLNTQLYDIKWIINFGDAANLLI